MLENRRSRRYHDRGKAGWEIVCPCLSPLRSDADDVKGRFCCAASTLGNRGNVRGVVVRPCSSEPCIFRRGTTVEMGVAFKANQDTPTLETKLSVLLGENLELPFPSVKKNSCLNQGLKCPLVHGTDQVFQYRLEVRRAYPKVNTTAKLSVTGTGGPVFCIKFPAIVTD